MKNGDKLKMMPKNYMEELAEWVKKREASRQRRDKNLVTFLALRADMKAAIGAGYTVKTIWEHLNETKKISCCYETFLKYIRQHITQQNDYLKPQRNEPQTRMDRFAFNATPKKEDLI